MSDKLSVTAINIEQAIFLLETTYKSGLREQVILLTGQPGLGKTSAPRAAADKLGIQCVVIAPSTMPPEDVGGIPWPTEGADGRKVAEYLLPAWWPTDPESKGFLVLDDMSQATSDVQKVLANLMLERSLRGHRLPDGWMIVGTGNRMEDRSGVVRRHGHLGNRLTEFHVTSTVKDWTPWAVKNNVRFEVIGFLNFKENLFCEYKSERDQNPTPRSWVSVGKWVDIIENIPKGQGRDQFALAAYGGAVGQGAATEFHGFMEMYGKLPDLDEVLKNSKTHKVDYEISVKYALVVALAGKASKTNLSSVIEYTDRLGVDFTYLSLRMAQIRDENIMTSPAFTKWAVANSSIISNNF